MILLVAVCYDRGCRDRGGVDISPWRRWGLAGSHGVQCIVFQPGRECRARGIAQHIAGSRALPRSVGTGTLGQGIVGSTLGLLSAGHPHVQEPWPIRTVRLIVPQAPGSRSRLAGTARRVAPLGWHVQTYTELSVIAALKDDIFNLPNGLVIDHFGRAEGGLGLSRPGLDALLALLREGAVHVKLSAAHRLADRPDCADKAPLARAMIEANPERVLWGSDWPHSGPFGGPEGVLGIKSFQQVEIAAPWPGSRNGPASRRCSGAFS